jgi:hypothetical protein
VAGRAVLGLCRDDKNRNLKKIPKTNSEKDVPPTLKVAQNWSTYRVAESRDGANNGSEGKETELHGICIGESKNILQCMVWPSTRFKKRTSSINPSRKSWEESNLLV